MTVRLPTSEEAEFSEALKSWRVRRGMTMKALAEQLHYDPSRIGHIEAGRQHPNGELARNADAVLRTGGVLVERWEAILRQRGEVVARPPDRELRTVGLIGWLATHSGLDFADVYGAVSTSAARIEAMSPAARHGRAHAHAQVTRAQVADALTAHYGPGGFARARVGGVDIGLSMLTEDGWLEPVELGGPCEAFRFVPPAPLPLTLDRVTVAAAIERLAAAETGSTVIVNNPLYRLLKMDFGGGRLDAAVTTVDFAEYAFGADLLGDELVGAIATGMPGHLPLRDLHLPDARSARSLDGRVCVGGLNTLVAAARGPRPGGERDYVLFVQERSAAVLNLQGSLAVIPKAFHQPTGEAADEVLLSATLRREIEEELFGREDLEQLSSTSGHLVDPMHARHTTEPLAWLLDRPEAWRAECTGFGLNMVTGNYDLPCLVVIEDESWWDRFGHEVETNWEAQHVHRYSTLDGAGLAALSGHPRWSNEGLFALLLGLRRLAEVGDPARVAVPGIDLEVL
jgi:transcriptional regulator with XRE-family HTH domain